MFDEGFYICCCLCRRYDDGCVFTDIQGSQQELAKPVNCATAARDLRVLETEKTHVGNQVFQGVSAIAPIGLVTGTLTGTEGDKIKVATGEYNKQIEAKIAEIKRTCNL